MGINGFPQSFPTRDVLFIDGAGKITNTWLYLLLAYFNRTGAGTGTPSVAGGVVASGAGQVDAFGLTKDWNSVDTVPGGSGVRLPIVNVGTDCVVFNGDGNSLKVYPSLVAPPNGPMQIDALGANAPYPLAAGKMQIFRCWTPGLIRSTQLG
jgi:hypothetical protein